MSQQIVVCLLAVAANLIGMIAIYAAMSNAIARRRTVGTIVLILISQLFWIVPAVWLVEARNASAGSYALWLGNWLVSGFSIVILCKTTALIPTALYDTIRMDGLRGLAAWRRGVLPFVRRDLLILGVFTVMATLLPFWGVINQPELGSVITVFQRSSSVIEHVGMMIAGSIAGAVPLVAISFAAKRDT